MQDAETIPGARTRARAHRTADLCAGAALGALLGMLMGMTNSPVVAIVISALVALLGALFGLSDKSPTSLSGTAARRLAAFGLAALLVTPAAVWIRSHELLGPSIDQQKRMLAEIGIPEAERAHMLRYLRFGILPPGVTAAAPEAAKRLAPALYAETTTFCDELVGMHVRAQPLADFERLLSEAGGQAALIGKRIAALTDPEKKKAAFDSAEIFLCTR